MLVAPITHDGFHPCNVCGIMNTVAIRLQKPQKGKEMKNRFYIREHGDDWAIFRNDEEYALVVGQMSKEAAEEMLGEMLGRGNWTGEYVPSCPNPDDEETITLVDEIDFIVPRGLRELWGGE